MISGPRARCQFSSDDLSLAEVGTCPTKNTLHVSGARSNTAWKVPIPTEPPPPVVMMPAVISLLQRRPNNALRSRVRCRASCWERMQRIWYSNKWSLMIKDEKRVQDEDKQVKESAMTYSKLTSNHYMIQCERTWGETTVNSTITRFLFLV